MKTVSVHAYEYEMLKRWAAQTQDERCGIISCNREGDKVIPTHYALSDKFSLSSTPDEVKQNLDELLNVVFKNEREKTADMHILMHTHPGKLKDSHSTGISVGDAANLKWWNQIQYTDAENEKAEKHKNLEILMGIASADSVSFWSAEKKGVRQLDIEIDGEKLQQPDIVKEQRKSENSFVLNKINKVISVIMPSTVALKSAFKDKLAAGGILNAVLQSEESAAEFLSVVPSQILSNIRENIVGIGLISIACAMVYCLSCSGEEKRKDKLSLPYLGRLPKEREL